MDELSQLEDIVKNLKDYEIDQIKDLLSPLKKGLMVEAPIIPAGEYLYRARRVSSKFNKQTGIRTHDLSYPPAEETSLGRVNMENSPMFYCGVSKEVIYFEIPNLKNRDEIILSFWQTSEKMLVNNIGYTQHIFEKLGANRLCPVWTESKSEPGDVNQELTLDQKPGWEEEIKNIISKEKNHAVLRILSEVFMSMVGEEEAYKYKLTAAIGEMFLGEIKNSDIQFAGIMYPTVRMSANGDNLALLPSFVDKSLEFRKALHVRIDASEENRFSLTYLDSATEQSESGHLNWLGRLPNWTLLPKQGVKAVGTSGRDANGDYTIDKDGNICHWVLRDISTGEVVEPT